jgi:anti-sigma-K factor RskA
MRQQHEKLLRLEKEYVSQLSQLTGYEKLSLERIKKETGHYATLVRKSQANLDALNMLDASKASEPAQIALISDLAAQEASLLERGEKYLKGIHDLHYLDKIRH